MKMKKIEESKGITLVALVITIIVLLILAAVTINLTLGERGIFNTAQLAAKNYTDAAEREETELANFQNEINNTLNGLGSGVVTKPEEPTQKWEDITALNYGDYVNYPVANGSTEKGHTTDWRIFYKDDDGYVYLISSYLLPYSQVPSGTNLQSYEGRPYTAYWPTAPSSYTEIAQETYDGYKMNFKYNGSPNNNQANMKCVSELMNTSKWSKFVNTTYALDAIGAPTLEMWVDSWNAKSEANSAGWTILTTSIGNSYGYNINGSTMINVSERGYKDTLYFPITSGSDANGYHYWLASPSAYKSNSLMCVTSDGNVARGYSDTGALSVRPLVRLKSNVRAEQGTDGVWNLK